MSKVIGKIEVVERIPDEHVVRGGSPSIEVLTSRDRVELVADPANMTPEAARGLSRMLNQAANEAEIMNGVLSFRPQAPGGAARPSWDTYFQLIARVVASRATCDRKHVGAVIVRERVIVCAGYNGSIRGEPHCDEVGHLMEDGHCVRTIHAEVNAITQAAHAGISARDTTLYVTSFPCWPCFKVIANAGIASIVFEDEYRVDQRVMDAARRLGIGIRRGPLMSEVPDVG